MNMNNIVMLILKNINFIIIILIIALITFIIEYFVINKYIKKQNEYFINIIACAIYDIRKANKCKNKIIKYKYN